MKRLIRGGWTSRELWFTWTLVLTAVGGAGAAMSFLALERLEDAGTGPPASAGGGITPQVAANVEVMRQFNEFEIYWLGEEFQGHSLRSVITTDDPGVPGLEVETRNFIVGLTYGDCVIPVGASGCPLPLSIKTQAYCESPPGDLSAIAKTGPETEIRGAPAQWTGGSLAMWTGNVFISIAGTDPALVDAAARNLVGLNGMGASSAGDPLGAPSPGLTCPPRPHRNQLENQ